MRIGLMVPFSYAFTGMGSGVRVQADRQGDALATLGHEVVRLDPWAPWDGRKYDVVQFFSGGFPFYDIEHQARIATDRLVFAPIIDSNQPNWMYRLAARAGNVVGRFHTIPGELGRQARGSDLVVCRSAHEQDRIVFGLGVPRERTRIVLNGTHPPPEPTPGLAARVLGLDGPFVLSVGAYCDPRKNVARLIEAVGPTGLPLVIVGKTHPNQTFERIKRLEAQFSSVRRFGYLPEDQLNAVQAACRVLAMPSTHEGTGLAALEAAAHGAALVITRNGGTRDYFQDLARYVDPEDVGAIRRAVTEAFAAPADGRLRERIRRHLTWEQSARSLIGAYAAAGTGR